MVARINTGKSIAKALNYNEDKLRKGKAELLSASGFLKDPDKLNFYDKLRHFERHTSLNDQAVTNSLHVSLNFDPSEKLSNNKLRAIAEKYMEQIGFGKQPFLVYRHDDAGHPHIHIVTTNIQSDGKRISMHNMGRNQSEKARKNIEIEFGLVKAESKKGIDPIKIAPVHASKVIYGKSETKRAISNVLTVVLNQYKYSSLPELNALLSLYNVVAERGNENSRMYKTNGLVYRVLDEKGNKVGTPVKASAFYMKPTMANLQKKFEENDPLKEPLKKKLKAAIDWQLNKNLKNIDKLATELRKENISLVLRKGKEGILYGLTYVDHKYKTVFNGSDLGKAYSAKRIIESLSLNIISPAKSNEQNAQKEKENHITQPTAQNQKEINAGQFQSSPRTAGFTEGKPLPDYIPYQLKKRKKKKRKRISF